MQTATRRAILQAYSGLPSQGLRWKQDGFFIDEVLSDRISILSSNGKSKEHTPITEVGRRLSASTALGNMVRRPQLLGYGVFRQIVTTSSRVLATSSASDDFGEEENAGQNAFMRSLDEKMNQLKREKPERKDTEFCAVGRDSSDLPSTKHCGTISDYDTTFLSRSEKKMVHNKRVYKLIEKYTHVLVCSADNVGSNQLQSIRQHLRPDSVVFLGKNAMMKRSIQIYTEKSGNAVYQNMIPLLVGNVGLIFTKGSLIDVVVPPGNTALELIKKGDKAGSSEADLLAKLGIRPFSHGLVVKAMYGNGSVFDPAVLDLVEDELKEKFSACFSLWQPFLCLSTILH